jgi:hypothetical protein
MKCFQHGPVDAVAVCAYCGRALCRDCIVSPMASRIACSSACASALVRAENSVEQLLNKTTQSLRASAFYCYVCAALSAAAAMGAWFMLPSPFLICFTAACAIVLLLSGIWYTRAARRHKVSGPRPDPPLG